MSRCLVLMLLLSVAPLSAIVIRPFDPQADWQAVVRLSQDNLSMLSSALSVDKIIQEVQQVQQFYADRAFFDVACDDGTLCGFCLSVHYGVGKGFVKYVVVDQHSRHKGIGHQLCIVAAGRLERRGCRSIMVALKKINPLAAWLATIGFSEVLHSSNPFEQEQIARAERSGQRLLRAALPLAYLSEHV